MHKSVNPGTRKLRPRCRLSLPAALLIVGLGLATAGSGFAQDLVSRREIDTPGLVVEPENNARMGECDVLTFAPDGKQLLAMGDDKVVRVWDLKEAEKGNKKELAAAAVPVLRWRIFRERRGNIYAMAFSPDAEGRYIV